MTSVPPSGAFAGDSSALVPSHVQCCPRDEQCSDPRGNRAPRPKCTYCHKWGHVKDKCFKLHGRPPRANLVHTNETQLEQSNGPT